MHPANDPDLSQGSTRESSGPVMEVRSPVEGVVVECGVRLGQTVQAGEELIRLESMKMEWPVAAPAPARVVSLQAVPGDRVQEGQVLVRLQALEPLRTPESRGETTRIPLPGAPQNAVAPDDDPREQSRLRLASRLHLLQDAARPDAVARRRAAGRMTAREIVDGLLEPGSLVEHGGLAVAAQRSRRPLDELERETPADGLITGVGTLRGTPGQRVAVMVYDATVLAGTQGVMNHAKADRLLELAARQELPLLLWAEGGGGRPGDVDWPGVAGLDCTTFARLAALSGQVPLVGLAGGRCFAGNAALLGCCDLIVATRHSSLGMAGPAMIEGGGLGKVAADDVGPAPKLAEAGVVDCLVEDDAEAVATGVALMRLLCGAPQRPAPPSRSAESLRQVVPAGRQAVFDARDVVAGLVDAGSWVECREHFGRAVVTGVGRLQGQPVAWAASQPRHGAGALDAAACDKLARFLQLADARGWPVVTLVDTPGFMVGPASEAAGMIRHAARVFVAAAALRVPVVSVVLRRGFGLGAMALTGGHFHAPVATAAWPLAEFGAMGLEGAVRLGFRKELEAAPLAEREALFQRLLDEHRRRGDALNMASHLEIDTVIDPAHTRDWLVQVLSAHQSKPLRQRAPSRYIDPW